MIGSNIAFLWHPVQMNQKLLIFSAFFTIDPVRSNPPHRPFGRASAGATSNGVDKITKRVYYIIYRVNIKIYWSKTNK